MNFKTTIVLIVLLAVVGLYLFVTKTSDTETGTVTAAGEEQKLIAAKSEEISRLSILPSGGQRIVIEKQEGNWRITEPVNAAADRYAVDSLVTDVTALTSRGKVAAAEAAQSPRYVVEVTTKDGKTHKLAIGERSAVGDHMYVQVDDADQADVVAATLYDALDKPLKDFRDTKLVNASSNEIQQIEIRNGDKQMLLQKTGTDWQILPMAMPGDSSAVSDLTFAITGLNADDYVTEDPGALGQYGLSEPVLTVWFSTEAPTTQPSTAPAGTTIHFGRYDDILKKNVFATVSGSSSIVKVPASTLERFRRSPLELRDKTVVQIDPETVTSVAIQSDLPATTQPTTREAIQQTITLQRQKDEVVLGPQPSTAPTTSELTTQPATMGTVAKPKWIAVGSAEAKVNEGEVDALLSALNPLQAEKFYEPAPSTQPAGTYVVMVTTESATKKETAEIRIIDPGNDDPLIGGYNGLSFELDRSLVEKLESDFVADEQR